MQSLLVRVSELNILGFNVLGLRTEVFSFLHYVLICETAVLPQLRQFWDTIQGKPANNGSYTTSIGDMKMGLSKLQDDNNEAKKWRLEKLSEGWENNEEVFYYQGLL